MGTPTVAEADFNVLQFEKKLTSLKDSQESINGCCQWCLQNRIHHKKIVTAWLNVLKRVKVEQRLILFYLANDVVQYSKKKGYDFVDSWGTAIQKATTMVRDEKVKHKILRIFKIWEQRGVYNEDFISDLSGLISVIPSAPKSDEPHEFQPSYLINKIKMCTTLEFDTDTKLRILKEHNPKIQITPELCASLKDRANVDDVENEIDVYVKHMEDYINALKLEIKHRITLISVLKQSEGQLDSDKKDVKVVANAYKTFATRVKTFQKKLAEHKSTLSSPIPSPDINAPSPSPDSDLDLPDPDTPVNNKISVEVNNFFSEIAEINNKSNASTYSNPGYYNPTQTTAPSKDSSFTSNGFTSFLGGSNPFNLENFTNSIFSTGINDSENLITPFSNPEPPPLPVEAPVIASDSFNFDQGGNQQPLLPPPMPPFNDKSEGYNNGNFSQTPSTYTSGGTYSDNSYSYDQTNAAYQTSEEYNPEQEVETWEHDAAWANALETAALDTPESPPMFEKEAFRNPTIEYHDTSVVTAAEDVDQRVIPHGSPELEDSRSSMGGKDVDHRNLISLTGSPAPDNNTGNPSIELWNQQDQDYRPVLPVIDQDYRLPLNLEHLKLPPPPPPPPKSQETLQNIGISNKDVRNKRKFSESVECTDMDLSDEEELRKRESRLMLEPPPPLPDLPEDVDANSFLDELNNDLQEFTNLSSEDLSMPPPNMPPGPLNLPNLSMPPQFNFQLDSPLMPPQNYLGSPLGPPTLLAPPSLLGPGPGWMPEEDPNAWIPEDDLPQWANSPGFRGGRGQGRQNDRWNNDRRSFNNDFDNFNSPKDRRWSRGGGGGGGGGRGGGGNFRGGNNNFRGRSPRGPRGGRQKGGNFRGNFRGGF